MNGWPLLLTPAEAANALRTDVEHVERLHAAGVLPGVRLFPDCEVRYRPEDILDVVDRMASRPAVTA